MTFHNARDDTTIFVAGNLPNEKSFRNQLDRERFVGAAAVESLSVKNDVALPRPLLHFLSPV